MNIKNIINICQKKLLKEQKKDGHWAYELEADTTIPSEYILMNHTLGIKEPNLEKKLCKYIKKEQNSDGGWPLFWKGKSNISTSVKAYYALKLSGEKTSSKIMIKARKGTIINFTTVAVPLNLAGEAVYAASKASVETLTKISAKELGEFGIRVNAIGPTPIKTDLIKGIPKEKLEELINEQAIKRFGNIKDVINTIEYLIDPASEFITGQTIYLGGIFD